MANPTYREALAKAKAWMAMTNDTDEKALLNARAAIHRIIAALEALDKDV